MKTLSFLSFVCLLALHTFAPAALAQSNSTVRFLIKNGTVSVQEFDVELFNADKPVTVSNFLWYVESASYSNTVLHYCASGLALQGGFGAVAAPASSSPFTVLKRIPTGPAIPSEFQTGARYTNSFGAIAMALGESSPSQSGSPLPNSGTASWFFSLANGSSAANLDAQRYTVFGRIISNAGTNALNFFNSLNAVSRIVTTTNTQCGQLKLQPDDRSFPLYKLPVSLDASLPCPRYSDLFNVEISVLNAPDVVAPQVNLDNPVANFITTNGLLPLSGTVRDNVAVSNVYVTINSGSPTNIDIVANTFSLTLSNLTAGTNIITLKAYDTSSNLTEVTRRIFYRVVRPIGLATVGAGTITGASNNSLLEVGRDYTIVAKPNKGNLFGAWTNSSGTNFSPTLRFRMSEGASYTATFGTNLFPSVQGLYNGLFYDADGVEQLSAGYLTLKVGSSGASSGKILLNGKSYSVKGTLNAFGVGEFTVLRKGTNSLVLDDLALDLTGATSQLTGTLSEVATTGAVWTAQLVADLAWFNGKDRIAPQAGKYTVILPADTNNPAAIGDGFGTVSVTTKGALSFAGILADGTKLSQKTTLSKNGHWPLYAPLYKDKGSLIGWLNFTNEPASDLRGPLNWFKQSQSAKYYAAGLTNETGLIGSTYVAPGASNAVLQITNATIALTNGNLAADFRNDFDVDRNGKAFDLTVTNKLKLSINKSSGLFSGSIIPPGTNRAMKFQGALYQKQTNGSGFFLGTNLSGRVSIESR